VKLTTHLHLVPRAKNEWSYTAIPPTRLHGVVLSLKKAQVQFYLLPVSSLVIALKNEEMKNISRDARFSGRDLNDVTS
jgi:hypothetical protein